MYDTRMSGPGRTGTTRRGGAASERKSRRRLLQLAVCLALFFALFVGKGVFPRQLETLQGSLTELIRSDTDFRSAFSALGEALSEGTPVLENLEQFCITVFAPQSDERTAEDRNSLAEPTEVMAHGMSFQTGETPALAQAAYYLRMESLPQDWIPASLAEPEQPPEPEPPAEEAEQPAVPTLGTVVMQADYTGTPLPEHYTMDRISLGAMVTVTPLSGHLRSEYGYRDHPIDGTYKFHGGIDIGGQTGDPIAAFADGTVAYVGEGDSYGKYLQLDHGNGVKSFYAHCSDVCVRKGQTVKAGETIAKVGSTGSATGPHLHLELTYQGTHLNPADYVDLPA